ncbi:FxLD family lanthipeptide [Actinoalloteichus spitiensis]|uniref:FxLD family lanthipeptide n=1 Tax=Actinoalloteichus spitiensis TaxID=252394 RepID=UPI0002E7866A|nr:FxLD family lanthipeptide [Actinoalloteichus spitiensis]
MSVQSKEAVSTVPATAQAPAGGQVDGWDLDVSIVETGPEADRLIQMTDDGCGQTCESACSTNAVEPTRRTHPLVRFLTEAPTP